MNLRKVRAQKVTATMSSASFVSVGKRMGDDTLANVQINITFNTYKTVSNKMGKRNFIHS